jgi:hypothetical protein
VNIQRLTSLGSIALMVAALGCGSSSDGKRGPTGTGGSGDTGTGGTSGTGGTTGTGGAGAQSSEFSFTLAPTALMLPLGGTQTVTVTIDRDVGATTFSDPLTFELDLPATITGTGVTAAFAPNPATAGSTTLTVDVGTTGIAAGNYTMNVVAKTGTGAAATQYTVALPLKVTSAAVTTLLVDNDGTTNNEDPTDTTNAQSISDTLFGTLLDGEGIAYNSFVADESMAGTGADPSTSTIASYSTIIWYTGSLYGSNQTMSPAQEAILEAWLDGGHKTLLIFSQNLIYDNGNTHWTEVETDEFLANYVGANGDAEDGDLDHVSYSGTGVAGTAFAGQSFHVIKDSPISSTGDVVNPKTGTDSLVTVVENPDGQLTAATAVPAVVGRKQVGAAGTSTVVYVGIPIEDVLKTTGNNSAADFFHSTLVYSGLKTQ